MYPKEMKPGLLCDVLFSFFIEYVDEMENSEKIMKDDENKKYCVREGAAYILNACEIRKKN